MMPAPHAPSVSQLSENPFVLDALEKAWADSRPADPDHRHEEGGWIYFNPATQEVAVRRAPSGGQADLDLGDPPELEDYYLVATFHTHPNPAAEGWDTGPSAGDTESADFLGVPCIIRADDGVHTTGPDARRGGLTGNPGYPEGEEQP
jgi:hypothetical protein